MKSIIMTLFLSICVNTYAQETSVISDKTGSALEVEISIFDEMKKEKEGAGIVNVSQSVEIESLVGKRIIPADEIELIVVPGFRTQVFTGNNQRTSKLEAFKKAEEIKAIFPNEATYVTYIAPFWKLCVGDFKSREEAFQLMKQLMEKFPHYAKEMYIVRENINILLSDTLGAKESISELNSINGNER